MKYLSLILFLFMPLINLTAQVEAGVAPDMIHCDVNNPGDETEVFDLRSQDPFIINGQENVVVSYHLTSGDALGGGNPIPNPQNYENIVNPQSIFARLQSTAGQGSSISVFQLIVPVKPQIELPPLDLLEEDPDEDNMAEFDLTENEPRMLGAADPFEFVFTYFTSEADAQDNSNAISNPEAYINASDPQTIYGRFEPLIQQCEVTFFQFDIRTETSLGLNENELNEPIIYPNPATDRVTISLADDDPIDGVSIFDLKGRSIINLKGDRGRKLELSLEGLSSGMYILEIRQGQRNHVSRLVIAD